MINPPMFSSSDSKDYLQQAFIKTIEESHGGEDVPIYANGPMAHLFTGVHQQTFIAHGMAYASCVGPNKGHCDGKNKPADPKPVPCGADRIVVNGVGMMVVLLVVLIRAIWS